MCTPEGLISDENKHFRLSADVSGKHPTSSHFFHRCQNLKLRLCCFRTLTTLSLNDAGKTLRIFGDIATVFQEGVWCPWRCFAAPGIMHRGFAHMLTNTSTEKQPLSVPLAAFACISKMILLRFSTANGRRRSEVLYLQAMNEWMNEWIN